MASVEVKGINKSGEAAYRVFYDGPKNPDGSRNRKTEMYKVKLPARKMTPEELEHWINTKGKEKALDYAKSLEKEVNDPGHIEPTKSTFKQFVERWTRDYAETNLEPKTIEGYKEKLTRILEAMGHLKIEQIKPAHLLEFYTNLQEDGIRKDGKPGGLSFNNIRHHHRVISSILQDAVEWQVIRFNPAARVKPPKVPKKQAACYDEEQAAFMLMALENEPLKYQVAVALTLDTGVREGELMGFEWDDVDFENDAIKIRQASQYLPSKGTFTKSPKTEMSEDVLAVSPSVMALLRKYEVHQTEERLKAGDLWRGNGMLGSFNELFNAVMPKGVSGTKLLKSLNRNKETVGKWEDNLQTLTDLINDEEIIQELRKFGVNAALEIAALDTLSEKQLKEFISLWQEKRKNLRGGRLFVTWDGRPMYTYTVGAWFRKFLARTVIHRPCGKVIGKVAECPHCEKPVKAEDIIKLPPLPFHGLRHTSATLLINTGVPTKTVSGRLRHASIGTTMDIYGHYLKSADREAADRLEQVFQRMKNNGKDEKDGQD